MKKSKLRKCPFCHSEMKIKTSLNYDETMNMQICCSSYNYKIDLIYDVYNYLTNEYYDDKVSRYINYWNNDINLKNDENIWLNYFKSLKNIDYKNFIKKRF